MIKSITHRVLYKDEHFFSSFPSIVLLDNTHYKTPQFNTPQLKTPLLKIPKLLLMFRRARDHRWLIDADDEASIRIKHQVDHVDSRSQLTQMTFDLTLNPLTEAEPLSINPEAADQDACLLVLSNKDILLSSFSWYPIHSRLAAPLQKKGVSLYGHPDVTGCYYILWGSFTRLSRDGGQSWSDHNYLPVLPGAKDIVPGKRPCYGGAVRGQAIEVDGEILLPVYGRIKGVSVSTSHVYASLDNGKTWTYRALIAKDEQQKLDLNEPSLLHLGGKRIMAFMRNTQGNDHLVTAISNDCGHNWEPWQEREITGHPTHPLRLSDGRIFLCYGYRHEPFGIRGHFMDSSAENFTGDEIIIRDDGLCGDVGYPWAVEMPDGKILVVYYFTQEDGIRHIAGSLIELDTLENES